MVAHIGRMQPRESTGELWGLVLGTSERRRSEIGAVRRQRMREAGPRHSLLHRAIERACRLIPRDRLVAVLARGARAPLPVPEVRRLVQPGDRGSAAEMFLGLLSIAQHDPSAVVAILPSDQEVDDEARFMSYVGKAANAVRLRPELPVMIAAYPVARDHAYTWIEPGAPVEGLESFGIRLVRRFVHEPSPAEIARLWEDDALVSTSVVVAKARTLIALGEQYLPEVLETLEPLRPAFGGPEESLLCEAVWEGMPYASVSHDLLGGDRRFAVLPIPDVMRTRAVPAAVTQLAS